MIDHQDVLRDAATRWYDAHLGEHLHRERHLAARRCACHLINEWDSSPDAARDLALQVLGNVEARSTGAYIDLTRTTSHALFLIDPATNRRLVFTAADLARVLPLNAQNGIASAPAAPDALGITPLFCAAAL